MQLSQFKGDENKAIIRIGSQLMKSRDKWNLKILEISAMICTYKTRK